MLKSFFHLRVSHLISIFNFSCLLFITSTAFAATQVSGTIPTSTWTKINSPYIVTGNLTVGSTSTLTIEPGVVVRFDGFYQMTMSGTLLANGTAEEPIIFESNKVTPAPGDWFKIYLYSGGYQFNHVIIRHADRGIESKRSVSNVTLENNKTGLYITGNSTAVNTNNVIRNNTQYGIYYTSGQFTGSINNNEIYNNAINVACVSNQLAYRMNVRSNWWGTTDVGQIMAKIVDFHTNNTYAAVDFNDFLDAPGGVPFSSNEYVYGNFSTTTWSAANGPYVALGDIAVLTGKTLTIEAGAQVRFRGNYGLHSHGTLRALGTAGNEIIFTSDQTTPAPGDWTYLNLRNSACVLDHVRIEYAQRGINVPNTFGNPTIQNSTLRDNIDGIYFGYNTNPQIFNNIITENTNGIHAACHYAYSCSLTASGNQLSGNSSYNFYQESTGDSSAKWLKVENNWWGSSDPNAITASMRDYLDVATLAAVDFSPFLDAPGGNPDYSWENRLYGNVSGSVALTTDFSPYQVIRSLTVDNNDTLTINPGVSLLFDPGLKLEVKGSGILSAMGTGGSPITFTSAQAAPAPGDWVSVLVTNAQTNPIEYCRFEHAQRGLSLVNSSPLVQNNTFENNQTGIYLHQNARPAIQNNVIRNNTQIGIHNVAYYTTVPQPVVNNNSIENNGPYNFKTDISQSNQPTPGVVINAESNWWGTADPVQIAAKIWDNADDNYRPQVDFDPYLVESPDHLITILDNTVTNRFFNPRRSETVQIQYTLGAAADVTIEIFDKQTGNLVRTLLNVQPRPVGANSETWDGKDNSAQLLPAGIYKYTIHAAAPGGKLGQYDPLDLDDPDPVISNIVITPAAAFSPFKGERLAVSYNLDKPGLVTLGVFMDEFSESVQYAELVAGQPRETAGNVEHWDGRDESGNIVVSQFPIYVEANTMNLPENILVIESRPSLDISTLVTDPYVIRPLYNEQTQITYAINEPADVTVEVLSPDGTAVLKTLETAASKTAGTYQLTWDGRADTGEIIADNGDYPVRVLAVDAYGDTVIRKGNIRVLY